jgi:hypothetical protein
MYKHKGVELIHFGGDIMDSWLHCPERSQLHIELWRSKHYPSIDTTVCTYTRFTLTIGASSCSYEQKFITHNPEPQKFLIFGSNSARLWDTYLVFKCCSRSARNKVNDEIFLFEEEFYRLPFTPPLFGRLFGPSERTLRVCLVAWSFGPCTK